MAEITECGSGQCRTAEEGRNGGGGKVDSGSDEEVDSDSDDYKRMLRRLMAKRRAAEEGRAAGGGEQVHCDGDKVVFGGGGRAKPFIKAKLAPAMLEGRSKQELLMAVEKGDEYRLRNALRHLSKRAINEILPGSLYTALQIAAKNNFPKLVTALLEAGADPNIHQNSISFQRCPLHYAAKNGNAEVVKALLKKGADPNAKDEFGHTALHYASENNFPKPVTDLLEAGADPNTKEFPWNQFFPLPYAAKNSNVEVVKALLEKGADPNAKDWRHGNTALHLLAEHWNTDEDSYKACLDALLACNKTFVDVLNYGGQSPLSIATHRGCRNMVEQLIYKGANIKTTYYNKTAEDLIENKLPGLLDSIDSSAIVEPQRHLSEELYNALIRRDIELFREILDEIKKDESQSMKSVLEQEQGGYTLLMYACKEGLTDFVKELLKRGADPSQQDLTSKINPILYAAEHGYYKILRLLLLVLRGQGAQNTDYRKVKAALKKTDYMKETALHKVVKREYDNKEEGVDYSKCLELLLDKKWLLDLDVQAELGYTEKRSQGLDARDEGRGTEECLVDLDAQSKLGFTALHHAVLHNDQSFVRELLLSGANFSIKSRLGTLAITDIQPSVLEEVLNDCIKSCNEEFNDNFKIILHYNILAPKQTLQQPEIQPEMEFLRCLSNSSKHRYLLVHPVIDTFLFLKWQKIKKYFHLNILVYSAFLILLTIYILLFHGTFTPSTDADLSGHNATTNTSVPDPIKLNMALKMSLQVLISICTLYLAVREGIQLYVSWRQYLMRMKNWLEILIILMTCMVLFMPMEAAVQQSVCAWLVQFSWIELVPLLGGHPALSIYITMLTKVIDRIVKFIAMFSSMVVAFSISFYLAFQVDEHFNTTSFTPFHNSLLKTLTMATAEIEYTDLPLDTFPLSSRLLYVAFVFLIMLVLMNLLNGLAVSDIHKIQQEAEIVSSSSRVKLMYYIESVLLASPLHHIFQRSLLCCEGGEEKVEDDFSFAAHPGQHNPARKLLNRLGRSTFVFQTCFYDKQSRPVFPNLHKTMWYVCHCRCLQLTKAQIEAAKDVVLQKKHNAANHHLPGMESRLDQLTAAVSSLTEKEKVDKHMVMEKELATANHRLSGLESGLDQLMDTVSSLTEKEKVEKHVVLEKELPTANHRLSRLESRLDQLTAAMLEKDHDATNDRLSGLESCMNQLMDAVSSLTEKVDQHVLCPSPQ
ncbi:transient receptor potential cation channel protein painless-like isoform X3 [Eriocheir sinensis]|uniref:transient receptor potential cation channel protein painless-like isoform X3 n=1 Tax=Eriocheir sinensis TaxID=95602 RepID=UPI0021C656AB|nr:transient receptor potential cation channel protein painless-like isoform X3 [Eriocheir sinensis]